MSNEREIAIAEMKSARNKAADEYFKARPQFCIAGMPIGHHLTVFNAGFERAWKLLKEGEL